MNTRKSKINSTSKAEPTTTVHTMDKQVESPAVAAITDTSLNAIRDELRSFADNINKRIDEGIASLKQGQNALLERINNMEAKQTVMENSFEYYSKTSDELKGVADDLTTNVERIEADLRAKQDKITALEGELLRLERHSRSFNLRFGGIHEKSGEDPKQIIEDIIKRELELDNISIENAHRTGKIRKNEQNPKPRHIIVKLIYRPQRHLVLRKARANKGKSFYVMEDLPAADVLKKNKLKDIMVKAFNDGKRQSFRNGQLYINGKLYSG